jgi:hypothetical protein
VSMESLPEYVKEILNDVNAQWNANVRIIAASEYLHEVWISHNDNDMHKEFLMYHYINDRLRELSDDAAFITFMKNRKEGRRIMRMIVNTHISGQEFTVADVPEDEDDDMGVQKFVSTKKM